MEKMKTELPTFPFIPNSHSDLPSSARSPFFLVRPARAALSPRVRSPAGSSQRLGEVHHALAREVEGLVPSLLDAAEPEASAARGARVVGENGRFD